VVDKPAWIKAGKGATIGTATIAAATDLFTIAAHGLVAGDPVVVDTLTGGAVGVLSTNAIYYARDVTANSFAIAAAPGDSPMLFTADGGAAVYRATPVYTAAEMRRLGAVLKHPGAISRFGARSGLRPGGSAAVTISGTTVTVQHNLGVIDPGVNALAGPYDFALQAESHSLVDAEANPRKDIVVIGVEDHDEDASGQRRVRSYVVKGTAAPSPGEPAVPTGAIRIATVDVPVSGGGSPTVTVNALWTVAVGGILPVRSVVELPTQGLYEGTYADHWDSDELKRYNGTGWDVVTSVVSTTSSGATAASGFSLSAFNAWRWGPFIVGLLSVARTGADITPSSSGNIADTVCATLPAGWRPIQTWYGSCGDGISDGEVRFNTDGTVDIRSWTPGGLITNGNTIRIPITFPKA
jgi:hypothetical protein